MMTRQTTIPQKISSEFNSGEENQHQFKKKNIWKQFGKSELQFQNSQQ
jgi:hypothetical protein